ncbi:acyl-CoA thioesterase [Microaerobacter geothermalis]|uniref:acyl-CoA thioesterase n=1 Tax=Microaerobacter geothermalis TaxID=674972 RepID=UPI001F2B8D4A|nr:thioesterase family protein [Microaerobacter geothermalis]MCF6093089.1 acyl-CoA thioesterase [Microaerobacter geothermalis]
MRVELPIIVRSTEIDVNGHVNNAKYLEYLEWGREEWYEKANLSYQTFLDMGLQTVTVNININYRKEAFQGDQLIIYTQPQKLGRTSYTLFQQIINQHGNVVADAQVTSVTIDVKTRKGVPVPQELTKFF